ncbi:hypothetical protein BHE74_00026583 [Ensete ventricosum]|nr:hypothetical protein BHE74_00026583 [Ensete ventricosum]RZR85683.1 hypothetical protein BHM03_00012697 [Ensete ventricosum]
MHQVDAFGNSLGVCRKLAEGIRSLLGWRKGVRQKKTETHRKIVGDDGPRYSLGIGPSSDDAVGSYRKFVRRFAEGIRKHTGNAKGDRQEEDRRTCRKIAGGCRSMRECRWVNRPNGGWTACTTYYGWRPSIDDG